MTEATERERQGEREQEEAKMRYSDETRDRETYERDADYPDGAMDDTRTEDTRTEDTPAYGSRSDLQPDGIAPDDRPDEAQARTDETDRGSYRSDLDSSDLDGSRLDRTDTVDRADLDRTDVAATGAGQPGAGPAGEAGYPGPAGYGSTAGQPNGDHANLVDDPDGLLSHWQAVQTGFVDDPRQAVQDADVLVQQVMKQVGQRLASERAGLEQVWSRGEDVSTEDLRQALQQYRSFFNRLLQV